MVDSEQILCHKGLSANIKPWTFVSTRRDSLRIEGMGTKGQDLDVASWF